MEHVYTAAPNEDDPETTLLLSPPPAKSSRPTEASSGRFKGVVLQQNANWGAQIYARHQRIWLGTFKSDRAAALAYDRAAAKLRPADAVLNSSSLPPLEPLFQNLHSAESIVAMIRDGSYDAKLSDFLRSAGATLPSGALLKELFRKELTPSDVGKLNRLVVPKKHAVHFFPGIEALPEGATLEFGDVEGRRWEFRYCYWRSSQSFVFTKGWNRFVKANQLRCKDVVTFYGGQEKGGFPSFYVIDASRRPAAAEESVVGGFLPGNVGVIAVAREFPEREEEEAGVGVEKKRNADGIRLGRKGCNADAAMTEAEPKKKPFQLFGVQISDA